MQEAAEAGNRMASIENGGVLLPTGGPSPIEKAQLVAGGDGAFLSFMEQPPIKVIPVFVAVPSLPLRATNSVPKDEAASPPPLGSSDEIPHDDSEDFPKAMDNIEKDELSFDLNLLAMGEGRPNLKVQDGRASQDTPLPNPFWDAINTPPRWQLQPIERDTFKPALNEGGPLGPIPLQPRSDDAAPMEKTKQLQATLPSAQLVEGGIQDLKMPTDSDGEMLPPLQPIARSSDQIPDRVVAAIPKGTNIASGLEDMTILKDPGPVPVHAENAEHLPFMAKPRTPSNEGQPPFASLLQADDRMNIALNEVDLPDAAYTQAQSRQPIHVDVVSPQNAPKLGPDRSSYSAPIDDNLLATTPVQRGDDGPDVADTQVERPEVVIERSFFDLRVIGRTKAAIPSEPATYPIEPKLPDLPLRHSQIDMANSPRPTIVRPAAVPAVQPANVEVPTQVVDGLPAAKNSPVSVAPVDGELHKFTQKAVELILPFAVAHIAVLPTKETQSLMRFEGRLLQDPPALTQNPVANSAIFPTHFASTTAPHVPQPLLVAHIREHVEVGKKTLLELTLAPEELGRIRLNLLPDGDRLRMVVQAERPEILDLLRRNADALAAELRGAGFASTNFSFGSWNETSDENARPDHEEMVEQTSTTKHISIPQTRTHQLTLSAGLDLRV